jgi:hypothetical protein
MDLVVRAGRQTTGQLSTTLGNCKGSPVVPRAMRETIVASIQEHRHRWHVKAARDLGGAGLIGLRGAGEETR